MKSARLLLLVAAALGLVGACGSDAASPANSADDAEVVASVTDVTTAVSSVDGVALLQRLNDRVAFVSNDSVSSHDPCPLGDLEELASLASIPELTRQKFEVGLLEDFSSIGISCESYYDSGDDRSLPGVKVYMVQERSLQDLVAGSEGEMLITWYPDEDFSGGTISSLCTSPTTPTGSPVCVAHWTSGGVTIGAMLIDPMVGGTAVATSDAATSWLKVLIPVVSASLMSSEEQFPPSTDY